MDFSAKSSNVRLSVRHNLHKRVSIGQYYKIQNPAALINTYRKKTLLKERKKMWQYKGAEVALPDIMCCKILLQNYKLPYLTSCTVRYCCRTTSCPTWHPALSEQIYQAAHTLDHMSTTTSWPHVGNYLMITGTNHSFQLLAYFLGVQVSGTVNNSTYRYNEVGIFLTTLIYIYFK